MEICLRRSRLHYKVTVEKVNSKILEHHEIKREEGPNKTSYEPATSYFLIQQVEEFYFCERKETASLDIRKVVP